MKFYKSQSPISTPVTLAALMLLCSAALIWHPADSLLESHRFQRTPQSWIKAAICRPINHHSMMSSQWITEAYSPVSRCRFSDQRSQLTRRANFLRQTILGHSHRASIRFHRTINRNQVLRPRKHLRLLPPAAPNNQALPAPLTACRRRRYPITHSHYRLRYHKPRLIKAVRLQPGKLKPGDCSTWLRPAGNIDADLAIDAAAGRHWSSTARSARSQSIRTFDPYGGAPAQPPVYLPEIRDADADITGYPARTGRLMIGGAVNSDAGVTGQITLDERNFDITRWPTSFRDLANGPRSVVQDKRFAEAMPGSQFKRYTASFADPNLFGYLPFSFGASAFLFDRIYQDWNEERLGGRLSWVTASQLSYRSRQH